MKRILLIVFTGLLFLILTGEGFAEESEWRQKFARICSMKGQVEQLSRQELDVLIIDSEKLLLEIESKDDPDVKLHLIRLKKCRNFFVFMRDFAQSAPQP